MTLFSHTTTRIFGVTCPLEAASVVIIPVPWEVTVSSRSSTSLGPESILKASYELGSMDRHDVSNIQRLGVALLPIPHNWKKVSDTLRHHTVKYVHAIESGFEEYQLEKNIVKKIDDYAYRLKEDVKAKALTYLKEDKLVGVLGGDHSVPLGLIEALAEFHNNFGILHIDAHPDLRKSYCGFRYSHASIMHHVLKLPHIIKLIQVGLRNCTAEELQVISAEEGRVFPFFDYNLKRKRFQGITWEKICATIVNTLPERVYISFDIDGLDARFCPSTGTPVSGGLALDEVCYLFEKIVRTGKKIVGFDLCEVAPGERSDWDAQVGSRVLSKVAMMMAISQGKMSF